MLPSWQSGLTTKARDAGLRSEQYSANQTQNIQNNSHLKKSLGVSICLESLKFLEEIISLFNLQN